MPGMNAPTLPIPNPEAWLTVPAAASVLGVDDTTVRRMIVANRLTGYTPTRGPNEHRPATILWRAEVEQLATARAIARGEKVGAR